MAGTSKAGLEFILSAKGADGVVREIGRVGQGIQQAERGVTRAGSGWQRFTSGIRTASGAVRGLWQQVRGLAAMTGIGAGLGFLSVAKDVMDAEDATLALQYQTGKTGKEWDNINNALERMRSTTGKTKTELVDMLDAATDFGVEIDDAVGSLEDMIAFSRLLRVDTREVAKTVGAISKATGGAMSAREIMAMLGAAAGKSGMPEEAFLGSAGRAARLMEGATPEQIQQLLQVVAGAGQEFVGQEKLIFGAFKALETLSPKQKTALGGNLGETGGETLMRLAAALRADATALDRIPLPDNIKLIAKAMAENAPVVDAVGAAAAGARGNLEGFATSLEAAKTSTGTQWAGLMEDLKKRAEPWIRSALSWLLENKEGLVNVIGEVIDVLGMLGSSIAGVIDFAASITGGPTTEDMRQLRQQEKEERERAELSTRTVRGLQTATTPEEKAILLARFREGVVPEDRRELYTHKSANRWGIRPGDIERAAAMEELGLPGAIQGGAAGLVRGIGRFVANIIVNANPETVHTQVDAEQDGERVPAIANAENG